MLRVSMKSVARATLTDYANVNSKIWAITKSINKLFESHTELLVTYKCSAEIVENYETRAGALPLLVPSDWVTDGCFSLADFGVALLLVNLFCKTLFFSAAEGWGRHHFQ